MTTTLRNPVVWGNTFWTTLHIILESLETENFPYFRIFIESFVHMLPCKHCRTHSIDYLKKKVGVITYSNRVEWGINFHNYVNEHTGKPVLSIEDAKRVIKEMHLHLIAQARCRLTPVSPLLVRK